MPDANVAKTLIRVFDLLRMLPKHGAGKTAGEIHETLVQHGYEIEKRTVERDLRMLQSAFPDYIRCDDQTKPFGWRWQPGRELCITNIQPTEAIALRVIEEALHNVLPAGQLDPLAARFTQARVVLQGNPPETTSTSSDLVRGEPRAARNLPPPVVPEDMYCAIAALAAHEQIEADLLPQQGETATVRRLALNPLTLFVRGTTAYLVAFPANTQTPELFALHRLGNVACRHQKNELVPPSFDLERFLANIEQGKPDEAIEHADIILEARIDARLHSQLSEIPLSEEQQISELHDGWRLQATVQDNQQLKAWILQQGASICIESPPALRSLIQDELGKATAAYRNTGS